MQVKPMARIKTNLGDSWRVPSDIATCPYCGGGLFLQIDQIAESCGFWFVDSVDIECENEPSIDSEEWCDFEASHSFEPYTYLLPVEKAVTEWAHKAFWIPKEEAEK